MLREHLRIEAVETHRDALQARGAQFGGVLRQQHAVGRERDVVDAGQAVRSPMRSARPARSSGSPPVIRSLRTPSRTNSRASRTISAKISRSLEFRKRY